MTVYQGSELFNAGWSAQPVVPLKRFTPLTPNGTIDFTTIINNALISLRDSGGGILGLPPASYANAIVQTGTIVLQDATGLVGAGMRGTMLYLEDGSNCPQIKSYVSSNGTESNAQTVTVRDLILHGNAAGQTAATVNTSAGNTSDRDGIQLVANPVSAKATNDFYFDPHQTVSNVWCYQHAGSALAAHGRSDMLFTKVVATESRLWGFVPSYDTGLVGCIAGGTYKSGFYVKDRSSVRLAACKSFYSGWNGPAPASAHGFEMANTFGVAMSSCEAQDNCGAGYSLVGTAGPSVLQACVADSNSKNSSGALPAIDLWASSGNTIDLICVERRADGTNSRQQNALRIRSNSISNRIRLQHQAVGGATVGQAITSDSVTLGNTVEVNNSAGIVSTAYAATITPDVTLGGTQAITLTGNTTIAAPPAASTWAGARLRFALLQDGTGSRTVTWNAAYKLAGGSLTITSGANKRSIIEFVYDGAAWMETSRSLNV